MSTVNIHVAPAASVAPVKLIDPDPGAAVIVPPPQDPLTPFGVATTSPAGSVSVNPTPVSEVPPLGLLRLKLTLVVPPTPILDTANASLSVGAATTVLYTKLGGTKEVFNPPPFHLVPSNHTAAFTVPTGAATTGPTLY